MNSAWLTYLVTTYELAERLPDEVLEPEAFYYLISVFSLKLAQIRSSDWPKQTSASLCRTSGHSSNSPEPAQSCSLERTAAVQAHQIKLGQFIVERHA